MAEAVVYFVLDQLKSNLLKEARFSGGFREELEHISRELEHMRAFLRDADAKEETDPQIQVWVELVQDVAYQTEEVLDEITFLLEYRQGAGFCGFLRKIACCIKDLKARHRINSKMLRIKSRIAYISERGRDRYAIKELGSSSAVDSDVWRASRAYRPLIEDTHLVGIEEPKEQLMCRLLDEDSSLKVVSVVGMGGIGKTTLVKRVFEDEQVKRNFQSRVWVSISQSFRIEKLLKDMIVQLYFEANQALPQSVETMSEDTLLAVIRAFLQERRYVIVFDDIWDRQALEFIQYALPKGNLSSRVLLTTRLFDIAHFPHFGSTNYIYEMKLLSDDESWDLFCSRTFEDRCCPLHLQELARKILRDCHGLPFAIVLISGILALKDKSRMEEWNKFKDDLSSILIGDKYGFINGILLLSYIELPYYLKICLLYLAMFPEHEEIEMERVIRLWSAEGLVQEREGHTVEEVAELYFRALVNRSLIQVAQTTLEGRPRTYCIAHDLVSDLILSKSRVLGDVHVASYLDRMVPTKVRRLAIHNSLENVQEREHFAKLRSLLVFGDSYSMPYSSVPLLTLLSDVSKLLRVLDLSDAPLETFPDQVCQLLLLKYLSMRNTEVKVVPKSIGKLSNLQTLDLRSTNVDELPVEIGKLGKLRHLLVYSNKLEVVGFKAPAEIGNLSSLQKLVTLEANQTNGKSIVGEVGKLIQLRTLRITNLRSEDGVTLCSSLEKLSKLRSLNVASVEETEIIDVKSLSPGHQFLQKLYLSGRLEEVPQWIPSLHSLTRVWLLGSQLMDDLLLRCLQDLPSLLELGLVDAYKGEELCFEAGGFQRLKRLRFSRLKALRRVRVEHGAMPDLVKLYIGACDKLEAVPSGIEHLTNLQSLVISGGVDSWVETLKDRDSEGGDYSKIAHIPQLRINLIR